MAKKVRDICRIILLRAEQPKTLTYGALRSLVCKIRALVQRPGYCNALRFEFNEAQTDLELIKKDLMRIRPGIDNTALSRQKLLDFNLSSFYQLFEAFWAWIESLVKSTAQVIAEASHATPHLLVTDAAETDAGVICFETVAAEKRLFAETIELDEGCQVNSVADNMIKSKSSTVRELNAIWKGLEHMFNSGIHPTHILLKTDSSAAAWLIRRGHSVNADIGPQLRRIFKHLARNNITLDVQWHRRSEPLARLADAWSKHTDISKSELQRADYTIVKSVLQELKSVWNLKGYTWRPWQDFLNHKNPETLQKSFVKIPAFVYRNCLQKFAQIIIEHKLEVVIFTSCKYRKYFNTLLFSAISKPRRFWPCKSTLHANSDSIYNAYLLVIPPLHI